METISSGFKSFLTEMEASSSLSTDEIATQYKNKILQKISSKILKFHKAGLPPSFTKEELAVLKKNSAENEPNEEVAVITPSPTITLKKGNTEINIKNAAALVQKMEEMYPTPNKPIGDNGVEEIDTKWKKATIYNNKGELEGVVENPNYIPPVQSEIKTVNKNAYEIRESILGQAIDVVKYSMAEKCDTNTMTDKILDVALKFYEFVENKKNKKY